MQHDYFIDEQKEEVRLKRKLAEVVAAYAMAVEENMLLRAEVSLLLRQQESTNKERSYVPQVN